MESGFNLTDFPYSKHDDRVDAITQALGFMRNRLDEPGIIGLYRMGYERMAREGLV